jgi:hypothetical protein
MGISKLISIEVRMTFLADSTWQLPRMIRVVQIAKIKMIKDSTGNQVAEGHDPAKPLMN